MEALAGFLYSFNAIFTPKILKQIHDYLLMLILRGLTFKPRIKPKTQRGINNNLEYKKKSPITFLFAVALDLLAEHAALFNKWLFGQFKTWFDALKSCTLPTKPKEIQESGLNALGKFVEETVQCLKTEADVERKSAILEVLFLFFTCLRSSLVI